jgi:hypothetical protein
MIEQGSPEWMALRLGKVTASRIADVLAKVKTGEAVTREDYRTELVVQRLTNKPSETFTNLAMSGEFYKSQWLGLHTRKRQAYL